MFAHRNGPVKPADVTEVGDGKVVIFRKSGAMAFCFVQEDIKELINFGHTVSKNDFHLAISPSTYTKPKTGESATETFMPVIEISTGGVIDYRNGFVKNDNFRIGKVSARRIITSSFESGTAMTVDATMDRLNMEVEDLNRRIRRGKSIRRDFGAAECTFEDKQGSKLDGIISDRIMTNTIVENEILKEFVLPIARSLRRTR